uniref:hypothetical protein n=1 Tax=Aquipuribacter sp. SD81 TaxID=3127703 RepID=UPI003016CA77
MTDGTHGGPDDARTAAGTGVPDGTEPPEGTELSDDTHGSDLPGGVTETGLQRAVGERRRRRMAERSGQVPLDATTSQWPVAEPPASPRPVVRPARPTLPGVATGPALPTPSALVVGPLVEARGSGAAPAGGRRARRLGGGQGPEAVASAG